MINEICEPIRCTGCGTCAALCPKGCIRMLPDPEGFSRPHIDGAACIGCELCRKKCPVNTAVPDDRQQPTAYAAKNRNDGIRKISSSGGVFTALAETVLSEGGVVFGAGFDEQFRVIHQKCSCAEELSALRQSKYVQSDLNTTFAEAKQCLEQGQTVLYTGTPCQIEGLRSFLGKEEPNLYTQDLICHGVPSPKLWERYLSYRKSRDGGEVTSVSFRDKEQSWNHYSMKIGYDTGSVYCKPMTADPFLRGFLMNLSLRPSCSCCPFQKIHRNADLTLADFWGIDDVLPQWNDGGGVSLVLAHSEQGKALLDRAKPLLMLEETAFETAIGANPTVNHATPASPLRKRYLKDTEVLPFDRLTQKYCGSGVTAKARRAIGKLQARWCR